jgi:glycosyltransferase involved in cell wall biosynthesis
MKIVHVEDFFHPDAGYQVNLLSRLQQIEGHEVTVVTAELDKVPSFLTTFFGKDNIAQKDAAFRRETGVKILRVPLLAFYSGRAIFSPSLFRKVSAENPDVVFVHGGDTLTGMVFVRLAKWLPYPIVLDNHMLEMASQNRFREYFRAFFRRFVAPVILRENIPMIRVHDSEYVQKCLGIPLSHTELLSFGTDTAHFCPNAQMRAAVRERHGIAPNAFVVLYAGKLDEAKGGAFLAAAIRERFDASPDRPIELMIVGSCDGDYGAAVERELAGCGNRLIRLPTQRYFDLAAIYQAADLAVYPKQCSMSFFEAQSCGLPVLFEENEINAQRANCDNAILFAPGDVEDFRRQVLRLARLPQERYREMAANARNYILRNYDYVPIAHRFTEILQRAVMARRARDAHLHTLRGRRSP